MDLVEFLKNIDIFNELDNTELADLAPLFRREFYHAGEFVFTENEPGEKLYIVEKGELVLKHGSKITAEFYPGNVFGEVAFINESIRTGSVQVVKKASLLSISKRDLPDEAKVHPRVALKILLKLTQQVTSYLRPVELTTTRELIWQGEGEKVEFKSTLRYNLYTKKFDKEIEHAVLKSVAAFLNSSGGTLLVGVDNKGTLLGLENDNFPNDDKLLLHFTMMVNDRLGQQFMSFIECFVDRVDQQKVLRVDVRPAAWPAYLEHNGEEKFYIRTGPSTSSLKISEHFDYVRNRFYGSGS